MKLIANMIAKNEADRFLDEVLEHLAKIADTIVFTDDASYDNTVEVAEKYGCHIYRNKESVFNVHEGALRQASWQNLENHAEEGDWILAIDADEKLYSRHPQGLDILLGQNEYDVINIDFYHMWNASQYRADKGWRPHGSTRLFRFRPNGVFAHRKMACGSEPLYVREMVAQRRFMRNSGLVMQHLGYMLDRDKKMKYDRYTLLDGGDYHAKGHIESILDTNPTLVDWN